MRKWVLAAGLFLGMQTLQAQYKYGLQPMTLEGYRASLGSHPEKELINLNGYIPGVVLDIRYATANNFTGEVIYNLPRAYARKPVADALKKVQAELKKQGLGLKIYDGYRPYRATVRFYELYRDTTFVASPYRGSRHNRGCALDLTLVRLATGEELVMPTGWDSFLKEAAPDFPIPEGEAKQNRDLLIRIMEKHGFKVYESEWWHFDFRGWERFEVMDVPFEELEPD
jgi:D-alanyl-D-alanine dipeptidase